MPKVVGLLNLVNISRILSKSALIANEVGIVDTSQTTRQQYKEVSYDDEQISASN